MSAFPRNRFGAAQPSLGPTDPGFLDSASERARRAYLRSLVADLPDPKVLIYSLPLPVVDALLGAWKSQDGLWRVRSEIARECSLWGLVEVKGVYLGAYGMRVRRTLLEMEQ